MELQQSQWWGNHSGLSTLQVRKKKMDCCSEIAEDHLTLQVRRNMELSRLLLGDCWGLPKSRGEEEDEALLLKLQCRRWLVWLDHSTIPLEDSQPTTRQERCLGVFLAVPRVEPWFVSWSSPPIFPCRRNPWPRPLEPRNLQWFWSLWAPWPGPWWRTQRRPCSLRKPRTQVWKWRRWWKWCSQCDRHLRLECDSPLPWKPGKLLGCSRQRFSPIPPRAFSQEVDSSSVSFLRRSPRYEPCQTFLPLCRTEPWLRSHYSRLLGQLWPCRVPLLLLLLLRHFRFEKPLHPLSPYCYNNSQPRMLPAWQEWEQSPSLFLAILPSRLLSSLADQTTPPSPLSFLLQERAEREKKTIQSQSLQHLMEPQPQKTNLLAKIIDLLPTPKN